MSAKPNLLGVKVVCYAILQDTFLHFACLQILGYVLDNTKANRAALTLLEQFCPQWIVLGCTAHSIALVFKDFARAGGVKERGAPLCPGLKCVYDMVKTISNTGAHLCVSAACLKISAQPAQGVTSILL